MSPTGTKNYHSTLCTAPDLALGRISLIELDSALVDRKSPNYVGSAGGCIGGARYRGCARNEIREWLNVKSEFEKLAQRCCSTSATRVHSQSIPARRAFRGAHPRAEIFSYRQDQMHTNNTLYRAVESLNHGLRNIYQQYGYLSTEAQKKLTNLAQERTLYESRPSLPTPASRTAPYGAVLPCKVRGDSSGVWGE